ncbi:MAG TPA: glycoside hydrolase [Bacteroidales bacterium]|nr:glycoside hydrolase [Bacteroidales bacterium]
MSLLFTLLATLFLNPVLYEDFSDPDAIRVGNDYYMTASSFNYVPGLPILHSQDLQHWELINHALPYRLPGSGDSLDINTAQHGNFVWAPSLRFHNGKYMIYYGDPDRGIFRVTTNDIRGHWDEPQLVIAGKGLIDPCPLFAKNGKVYLVHALAGSRAHLKSVLMLTELNADGSRAITPSRIIYDGHSDNVTCEGPKIHEFNGFFYIFFPAGGVPTGWQVVARSKDIYGPYQTRVVMHQGSTKINGPHQGAWVDNGEGKHFFIHFQDVGPLGRITHIQNMIWTSEGWPVIGERISNAQCGQPQETAPKANDGKAEIKNSMKNSAMVFQPHNWSQWQWNYNVDMRSCFIIGDTLRLFSLFTPGENLWLSRTLFTRRISGNPLASPFASYYFTLELNPDTRYSGERGGCVVFGKSYAGLVLTNDKGSVALQYIKCDNADKGSAEQKKTLIGSLVDRKIKVRVNIYDNPPVPGNTDRQVTAMFLYSTNGGITWQQADSEPFKVREGVWTGARIALFCSRNDDTKNDGGYLNVYP